MLVEVIIVESPKKASTIQKMFPSMKVFSTQGTIKELPANNLGYDEKYEPFFSLNLAGKLLKKTLKSVKDAKCFYIGCDSDREGEAIAAHVSEILNDIGEKNYKRIVLREITFNAIQKALNETVNIDFNLVQSQIARRIADRMIGFTISPLMQKYLTRKSGAGRVQSVALDLIYQRFIERENFVPTAKYSVFLVSNEKEFQLDFSTENKEIAEEYVSNLKNFKNFFLFEKKEKVTEGKHIQVLKTVTLQRNSETFFNLSPNDTMRAAQSLFEGIKIGGEEKGLVTYIRTDSLRVSKEFLSDNEKKISEFGELNFSKLVLVSEKSLNVQDAHEAIRPVDLSLTPEKIKEFLSQNEFKVYSLIFYSFIAACLQDPLYNEKTFIFKNDLASFSLKEVKILKPSYLNIDFCKKYFMKKLSFVDVGEVITADHFFSKESFTKAPSLFTESSLIELLESFGIGRPSTYATIAPKLEAKHFIFKEDKRYAITQIGRIASEDLRTFFNQIFNVHFTSELENDLDLIYSKQKSKFEILKRIDNLVSDLISNYKEHINKIFEREISCFYCSNPVKILSGRYGLFISCCKKYSIKLTDSKTSSFKLAHNFNYIFLANNCEKCKQALFVFNNKKPTIGCIHCRDIKRNISIQEYKKLYIQFFIKSVCPFFIEENK